MYNIGKKLYCKKDYYYEDQIYFKKGKVYKVVHTIECEDDLDYYNVENEQNDIYLMFAEKCTEYIYAALDRFFKTPTELRNEKLKKLDCL